MHTHTHTHTTIIQDGAVPLGIAAKKGHTQTVQKLLKARANVNHQNKVMISTCVCVASYAITPQTRVSGEHLPLTHTSSCRLFS